jgi:hypothetical protein
VASKRFIGLKAGMSSTGPNNFSDIGSDDDMQRAHSARRRRSVINQKIRMPTGHTPNVHITDDDGALQLNEECCIV